MRPRTGYGRVLSANCLWILPIYFRAAGQRPGRYENMPFLGPDLASRRALGGNGHGQEAGERRAMLTLPGRKRTGRWPTALATAPHGLIRNAALVAAAFVILVAGAVTVVVTSPDVSV